MGQALGPLDNPEKNPVSRDLQLPTSRMRSLTYIHPSSLENLLLASGMPEAIGTQEESHAWAGTSLNPLFWVGFKLCARSTQSPRGQVLGKISLPMVLRLKAGACKAWQRLESNVNTKVVSGGGCWGIQARTGSSCQS